VLTPGRSVLIKGDRELSYGDVKNLIAEIRKSGAGGVSLAASTPEGAPADGK
jgi:biopolymer transport protein ExbD